MSLLSAEAAARYFAISVKTLRAHVAAGDLTKITVGRGTKRPHYAFAPGDLDTFIRERRHRENGPPCPSTSPRARQPTDTTSGVVVYDFQAGRDAR